MSLELGEGDSSGSEGGEVALPVVATEDAAHDVVWRGVERCVRMDKRFVESKGNLDFYLNYPPPVLPANRVLSPVWVARSIIGGGRLRLRLSLSGFKLVME